MRIEYLARGADNTLICVTTTTDLYSARFFIGTMPGPLREVPIAPTDHSIMRLRDGGTTIILTAEGEFNVPSPLLNAAWMSDVRFGAKRFDLIDRSRTTVELTDGGLLLDGVPADT
ncbi:hypothetical protein [Mycobacterium scrofulaceum]|uniref:Uncharacterized protein n=1 Tax=Mycobacterium scrofulaceum TaxID=1783 RepID=A0A1A2UF93_MYCSC|nr:hypothetical protein [Mycobacterium scrofulaceum]OBH87201.1 hypothetical protein A5681_13775 [Mycobacterium scrofulaceum]OBI02913.1 hypothetical protein A5679_17325 [Mycobacterium scrofulaceum]